MKRQKRKLEKKQISDIAIVIRSVIISIIATLVLVALLSLLLYKGTLGLDSVPIANTIIKILGSVFAAFLSYIAVSGKKMIWCGGAGLLYALISYIVFSAICKEFSINLRIITDMGIGVLSGVLTTFVCGLIKR